MLWQRAAAVAAALCVCLSNGALGFSDALDDLPALQSDGSEAAELLAGK